MTALSEMKGERLTCFGTFMPIFREKTFLEKNIYVQTISCSVFS